MEPSQQQQSSKKQLLQEQQLLLQKQLQQQQQQKLLKQQQMSQQPQQQLSQQPQQQLSQQPQQQLSQQPQQQLSQQPQQQLSQQPQQQLSQQPQQQLSQQPQQQLIQIQNQQQQQQLQQTQPQTQQQQQQLLQQTQPQVQRTQSILSQQVLKQEHLIQLKLLLKHQRKQEEALLELLQLQDDNGEEEIQEKLSIAEQRPQIIEQQYQLHLQQQHRQQIEQQQELQALQQKCAQSQLVHQPQHVQQPHVQQPLHVQQPQQQQSQLTQQTQQLKTQELQQSQIIQHPLLVEQPHFVQQSQIVQQQQQQIQYKTVSTQQKAIKQPPHSQQLLQQQLQQILSTNKNYSQRIVVLGSQPQQQQLVAQQPQHIVTTNITSQQQLPSQQMQCVITDNTEQQPQQIQRVVVTSTSQQQLQHQLQHVVTGNGQQQKQQQQMQRVVGTTSQEQQQLQLIQDVVVSGTSSQQSQQTQRVISAVGQQQQQIQQIHLVVPGTTCQQQSQRVIVSTANQQLQQIQNVVSGTTIQQQSHQIQRIIVSTAGQQQQQQIQQIPHIVVPGTTSQQQSQQIQSVVTTSSDQQQLSQQIQPSAQRIVIGQLKPSQVTQQSSSQCGVVFDQLHQQDMQRPITGKQQQQRVVITGQQQLLKLPQQQQQSPQQQIAQQILQPIQQQQQQVVQQLQQKQLVQQLQQQQQTIQPQQKLTQCVGSAQQNVNTNSSNENLQELQINQLQQLQLPVESPQEQVQQHQINKQPQQQNQPQENQLHLEKKNQQQVEQHIGNLNRSGVIVGQLPRPIQSEPEEIQQPCNLQQLQRQKLHTCLLKKHHKQHEQKQQSGEQQVQNTRNQQQLREQVLLNQHFKQQRKQQQIQQQLLLRRKALPERRLSIVMDDNQKQKLEDDNEEINHCEKSPVPKTLNSIIEDVAIHQFRLNNKGSIDNCVAIEEEKLVLLSSSSDEDEDDEVICKQRNLILEAERLVIERYNALSVALGPKNLAHYHEILLTWLGGQLSQKNFESDIQKVMSMSWTLEKTSGDSSGNIDEPVSVADTNTSITVTSNAYIGSIQDINVPLTPKVKRVKVTSKKKSSSMSIETRPKTKAMTDVASPLNKEMNEKQETTANMKINKTNSKDNNLSLHNALMASLATWMPLNSQKTVRRMARARGVTVTGCPLRLYTYPDVPQARGSSDHWYPEEPGSLPYWYWPDQLSYNISPVKNDDEKQFTWEKQKKDSANARAAAVLLRPPSRTMLPLLLRMATEAEATRSIKQMQWPEEYPMKSDDINVKTNFRWHQLKEENKLATMIRLRDGHKKLLSQLKVRSRELGIQECQVMEDLRLLQTRMLQKRRKLLALFEIRKENLKVRIYKHFDRSWQERPEDQVRRQILIETIKTMEDDESDNDKTEDDDDCQNRILKQHLERVNILKENKGPQQYQLEAKPTSSITEQIDGDERTQFMVSTIKLLRDRLQYQTSHRMLQSIRQEQLQVSKHTDRVRELRHKNCPCGESNDRPCRYRKQIRKFRKQLQVLELNVVDANVNKELANDAEKEKAVAKESEKLETAVAENKKTKAKKKKIVIAKTRKTKTVRKKTITRAESKIESVDNNKVIDGVSTTTTNSSTTKMTNNTATKTNTTCSSVAFTDTATTKIAAPQVLDIIDLVEDDEKHDSGSDCELIQDKSSLLIRSNVANTPRRRRQPLRRKDGKFTVNVVAAATRAAQAAIAASRRTQKRRTDAVTAALAAAVNESIDLTVEEDDDNNRKASVLMPPPPPPSRTMITPKKPSIGAKYLKQQQLLLDRHKELQRMRQEEEKRQERAHESQENDNVEPLMESENVPASLPSQLPSLQLARPKRRDKSQEKINNDFDKKLHSNKDDEFSHLVHDMGREKDGLQSNYNFYYGDDDYYSSDDEMTELLSNEPPFPPLLHDLRIDQIPQSSIRVPDATRTTSVIQSLRQSTSSSSVDLDIREYELGQQNMHPVNKRKRKINESIEKKLIDKQLQLELQERPGLRQEVKYQHKNGNKSVIDNQRMKTAELYPQQQINMAQKRQSVKKIASVELQSPQWKRRRQATNKLLDVEETPYCEEQSCAEPNFEHKQTKCNENQIKQVAPVTKNKFKRQSKHISSQKLQQNKNVSTITTEEKPPDLKTKEPETTINETQLQFIKLNDEYAKEKDQDVESEKIKSSKVNVNHSKCNRDLEKNKHVLTDHYEQLKSDVNIAKDNCIILQNLLYKYLEIVVSLPSEYHLQQMLYLKQQLGPLKNIAGKADSVVDVEMKILKEILSLTTPLVTHNEARTTLEESNNLLSKIRQQRAIIQQSLNISDINDKYSGEVPAEGARILNNSVYEDLKFWFGLSSNKNETNNENEQRMSKIKEMVNQCFFSSYRQTSACTTDVEMQQLGPNSQEQFVQDQTDDSQRREQKIELLSLEKQSLMEPNAVEELDRQPAQDIQLKQRKQLNQTMCIKQIGERLKALKLKKIRLYRENQQEQEQDQELPKKDFMFRWRLGKLNVLPVPYYDELFSLHDQLMSKILMDKYAQLTKNEMATAPTELKPVKLNQLYNINRGSATWLLKTGMLRRISPLVMPANKRSDEQTTQISMVRIADQPQLTRPQTSKVAAKVIINDRKQITSQFSRTDEKEYLKAYLLPHLLRMMTKKEEKWLIGLQTMIEKLSERQVLHWNNMIEKQHEQVRLLFLFDREYHSEYRECGQRVDNLIIAANSSRIVTKAWLDLELERMIYEQQWKTELESFLRLKYVNRMFSKELFDRLIDSQCVDVREQQLTKVIAAYKQLQHHSPQKPVDHQSEIIASTVKPNSKQLKVDDRRRTQRKDNQKPQLTELARQNHGGCKMSVMNAKPSIMTNSNHLRNQVSNMQSQQQKQQQPQRSVSTASTIVGAVGKQPWKQDERNTSIEWILKKLTYFLYNQRIVLQREMDRTNEQCSDKLDIQEEPSVSPTHMTSIHQSSANLDYQQPSTSKQHLSMPPIVLPPQLTEQQSTQSRMTASKLAVHRQQEKHQLVEQKLDRVNRQLKPLMELWLCLLRFPARWIHQQLDEIEEIKREESKRSGERHRKQQTRGNDGQPVVATDATATEWAWQQLKQIYDFLEWRQQRVGELVNELALAMPWLQTESLETAVSRTKQPPSTYSVLLKLQQPLTSSQKRLTYSVSLKLQQPFTSEWQPSTSEWQPSTSKSQPSTSESQPLRYSSVLTLEQTANNTEPSKYSALLRLQHPNTSDQTCSSYPVTLVPQQLLTTKQQSTTVLLTPQGSSTFQSKFPNTSVVITPHSQLCTVILEPQQPSTVEDQPSTSSVIHTLHTRKPSITVIPETVTFQPNEELHHQLNDNQQITKDKRRLLSEENDENKDGCKKLKTTTTTAKRPRSPSDPICPKRLRSTPHPQTNQLTSDLVTTDDNTIIILDSDDEPELNNSDSEADTCSDVFDSSSQSSTSDNTHQPVTNMSVQISDKSPLTIKFIKTKPLPTTVTPCVTTELVDDVTNAVPLETENNEHDDDDDGKTTVETYGIDNTPSTVADRSPTAHAGVVAEGPADATASPCEPTETATIGSSYPGSLNVGCRPLKIAVIKCSPSAEAPMGGDHLVNTVKSMVVMNRRTNVMDVISKLTEASVAAAKKTPVVIVGKPRATGSAEEAAGSRTEGTTDVTTNCRRRRRRLLRTVTVDASGPAVPAFRDHGLADGSVEQAVHERFLATIMAMTAAHSIASHVQPRQSQALVKRAIVMEGNNRAADKTDDGRDPGDKANASTNTPIPLSSVMDWLENEEQCPTDACGRDVHRWSGCARTEGTALVALIGRFKSSGGPSGSVTPETTPARTSVSAPATTAGRGGVRPAADKMSSAPTTTITEEETRTVTITRTVRPTVQPPMDVTADACALVASTCEKFVRAMVMERTRKAGRGAGTLELRRRDAYAAAVAMDDSIRPMPDYRRTTRTTGTTATGAAAAAAAAAAAIMKLGAVEDGNVCERPPAAQERPWPTTKAVTIVRDGPDGGAVVETVETTEETHVTTILSENDAGPRPRPAVVDDTSARTRGGAVPPLAKARRTSPTRDVRPLPSSAAGPAVAAAAAVRVVGPPAAGGFVAERSRSLLRPAFHRRRPFDALTSVCVAAAAEATAVNDAAYTFFDSEPEEEWLPADHRSGYFGDRDALPPFSRLNGFFTNGDDDDDGDGDGDGPRETSAADRWRPSRRADLLSTTKEQYHGSMLDHRQQLMAEIVRQRDQCNQLQRAMEQRILEQKNKKPDTPDEYYRKFLQLQYGSTPDTSADDDVRPRGLVSW